MQIFQTNKRFFSFFLHILFLCIAIVWAYPLIWTLTSSFKTNTEIYRGDLGILPSQFHLKDVFSFNWSAVSEGFRIENYTYAWSIANFDQYFVNTVIFAAAVVLIVVTVCGMTGYVLGRYNFPGKWVFIVAVTATMFIPHGYTIIPIWQLINALGLSKSIWGLILAEAGSTHVMYILLFMTYFHGIPKEIEEAAKVDGSGLLRTFLSVMVPLSKPVIATTATLQFIFTWNSFFVPLIFTIHRPDLRTLGVGMYSFVEQYSQNTAAMAAGATISFIPIVLVFLFFQRYFVEGIAGAVKG
jgi:multiple sugar transport system permease protein